MKNKDFIKTAFLALFILFGFSTVSAQTNEFTYQGRLNDNSLPANANYDFEFRLFDASASGTLLGTRQRSGVPVSNGVFTVRLDFPAANFNGDNRWLEIAVKPAGAGGGFQQLLPRQPLTSSPYSVKSLNAENAVNSTKLEGIAASGFVQNTTAPQTASFNVTGNGTIGGNLIVNGTLTANLPAGDASYVQNRTTQQTGLTNFNIGGNGTIGGTLTAGTVNGGTISGTIVDSSIYRIGGESVLRNFGTRNLFAGVSAGGNGTDNSFFGYNAGGANLSTGIDNSFFGSDAGGFNTSGTSNSFFGSDAGDSNTSGNNNTFVGRNSGTANSTGDNNSFFGINAGNANGGGNNNTVLGANANVGGASLVYATAIGADAVVSASNTIQLGRITAQDTVRVPGYLRLDTLGVGGSTRLCLDGSLRIATCSASANLAATDEKLVEVVRRQNEQIREMLIVIDDLKRLVCQNNSQAAICKEKQK